MNIIRIEVFKNRRESKVVFRDRVNALSPDYMETAKKMAMEALNSMPGEWQWVEVSRVNDRTVGSDFTYKFRRTV